MANYRKSFELEPNDIALIENALRRQVYSEIDTANETHSAIRKNNRDIQNLLGKLSDQQVFYSQVNKLPHPGG